MNTNKTFLFLSLIFLLNNRAQAATTCFLAKEGARIISQEGDCTARHAPCSTFKIAISLMAYNEGIITNETHPELPFQEDYIDWIDSWKQSHNPTSWMQHSCIWYSQIITRTLGMQKFKDYVALFTYGNQDVSGDKRKSNGLTHSWLSSSLQISCEEQIIFLQKLLDHKLSVSLTAHAITQNILFIENLVDDWKLYGKTGSGYLLNHDESRNEKKHIGWFIGWITNNNRIIIFAHYIEDDERQDTGTAKRAKEGTKKRLLYLIHNMETK